MASQETPKGRMQLTKAGLVEAVYQRHGGLSRSEACNAVDSVLDTLKSGLQGGRKIKITNFGVFEIKARRGRIGVDPVSGERIAIPAHRGLSFRPSEKLRSLVQGAPVGKKRSTRSTRSNDPANLILLDEEETKAL